MSHLDAMSCAEAEPLLPLVADGALDPDSDPHLFAHLAACPTCQQLVAQHDLIGLAIRQAAPGMAERPRNRVLHLWTTAAAAAGIAIVAGAWLWPVAGQPPAQPVAAAVAQPVLPPAAEQPAAPTTDVPDVIAVQHADGSTHYLVRQGEAWVAVDPANMDGPTQPAHGSGSGVQVRY
jgi:hypothetical protein